MAIYQDETVGSGEHEARLSLSNHVLVGFSTPMPEDELAGLPLPDSFRVPDRRQSLAGPNSDTVTATFLLADDVSPDSLEQLVLQDEYAFVSPAYELEDSDGQLFSPIPGKLIVGFKADASRAQRREVELSVEGQDSWRQMRPSIADVAVFAAYAQDERPTGQPAAAIDLRAAIDAMDGVDFAELDWFAINPQQQGGGAQQPNLALLQVPADGIPNGISPAPLAVLDGGFQNGHPGLQYQGTGIDVITGANPGHVWDTSDPHGTAVAGVAVSLPQGGGPGAHGVAEGGQFIPIRVYKAADTVEATASDLSEGIVAAVNEGARVINISLGRFLPSNTLYAALQTAEKSGVVVVAGSGNLLKEAYDTEQEPTAKACRVNYPAAFPTVIAVGAVGAAVETGGNVQRIGWLYTQSRPRSWASCYGSELDVVAPGIHIHTTDPTTGNMSSPGDYFEHFAGTSAASPHIAGLAALLCGMHPAESPAQIRARVFASCIMPDGYNHIDNQKWGYRGQWNLEVGFGIPSVAAALDTPMATTHKPLDEDSGSSPVDTDIRAPVEPNTKGEATMVGDYEPCTGEVGTVEEPKTGKAYEGHFRYCIRPLSAFMNALVAADAGWPELLRDFWKNPYQTARIAGLPWYACIALAEGDRATIDRLVGVEVGRDPAAQEAFEAQGGSGGPIGVKLN